MILLNVFRLGEFLFLFLGGEQAEAAFSTSVALLVPLQCCFANLSCLFFMACGASIDGEHISEWLHH